MPPELKRSVVLAKWSLDLKKKGIRNEGLRKLLAPLFGAPHHRRM